MRSIRSMSRVGFGVSNDSLSGNRLRNSFFDVRLLPTSSFFHKVRGIRSDTSLRNRLMLGRASPFGPHQILPSRSRARNFSSEIRQKRPGGGAKVLPLGPTIVYCPLEYGLLA